MQYAALALLCGSAWAQAPWPSRPVAVIIPLNPGSVDNEIRPYADALAKRLGAPFVLDYKPGAGTRIGTGYMAKAKPDGYTIGYVSDGLTVSMVLDKNLPYDPAREIEPVSLMTKWIAVLVGSPKLPAKNAAELFTYAKANPGKVNWITAGPGSTNHMTGAWVTGVAGVEVTFVHYKGNTQAFTDMAAGRVDVGTTRGYSGLPLIRAGKLRALGVSSATRYKSLPEVPTYKESGIDYDGGTWVGIGTTGGTPLPIVNRLSRELAAIARSPENMQKKEEEGGIAVGSTPEEFRRHIAEEVEKWRVVAAKYNIKAEEP